MSVEWVLGDGFWAATSRTVGGSMSTQVRLREVNSALGEIGSVALYYDAEHRRVRKLVEGDWTVYFLVAWNEVQESDCGGLVSKQYVYGGGVDELFVMDVPLPVYGTSAFSWLAGRSLLPGEECIDVMGSPPDVHGVCGPCLYDVDSGMVGFDCLVCVEAWSSVELGPRVGCVPRDVGSGCRPCDQSLDANAFVDEPSMAWGTWVHASSGCLACPDQPVEVEVGVDDQLEPSADARGNHTAVLRVGGADGRRGSGAHRGGCKSVCPAV